MKVVISYMPELASYMVKIGFEQPVLIPKKHLETKGTIILRLPPFLIERGKDEDR